MGLIITNEMRKALESELGLQNKSDKSMARKAKEKLTPREAELKKL